MTFKEHVQVAKRICVTGLHISLTA